MSIIATIVIGLIVGLVARFLIPGRDPAGIIITVLLGIAGAFLATWFGQEIGWYRTGEPAGFIASVLGAVVLLVLFRMVRGRRGHHLTG